jgi:hypothetical protein
MPWLLAALGGGATAAGGAAAGGAAAGAAGAAAAAPLAAGAAAAPAAAVPLAAAPAAGSSFLSTLSGLFADTPVAAGLAGPPAPGLATQATALGRQGLQGLEQGLELSQRFPTSPPPADTFQPSSRAMTPPQIGALRPSSQQPPSPFVIQPTGLIAYRRPILPTIGG